MNFTENIFQCDSWIVKMNGSGVPEWKKSFGGTGIDLSNAIQQTVDGGYIFTGWSNSIDGDVTGNFGFEDVWVVKLDNIGNIQWQKSFGGTGNDQSYDIQQTTDGGYIIAGISSSNDIDVSSNNGCFDYWIVKLNNTGIIQWEYSTTGASNSYVNVPTGVGITGVNFISNSTSASTALTRYKSSIDEIIMCSAAVPPTLYVVNCDRSTLRLAFALNRPKACSMASGVAGRRS